MARRPSPTLTEAEYRLMDILWDLGNATVSEIRRLREDLPEPSLPQERALTNAPETKDGFFVVKAIQESEP